MVRGNNRHFEYWTVVSTFHIGVVKLGLKCNVTASSAIHGGLMVSMLDSEVCSLSSSTGQGTALCS